MNQSESNPFSTRFIRPGAVSYVFPSGDSIEQLIDRLRTNQWRGEIIGPHGSGKSTLLSEILPQLQASFNSVFHVKIQGGQSTLPPDQTPDWSTVQMVVIDGYEQLSWWTRRSLQSRTESQGCGLLVTAHESVGLPEIFRTKPTTALVEQLAQRLQSNSPTQVSHEEIAAAYAQHHENVRETFFALYDLCESKRRQRG